MDELLPYGFSWWRKMIEAFLEVNRDFLWMLDGMGGVEVLTYLKSQFVEAFQTLIQVGAGAFLSDLRELAAKYREQSEKSQPQLPA